MNIGFDAKRAFHNKTGLGNHSRNLISGLANYFPENNYYLFNPKKSNQNPFSKNNIHEIRPSSFLSKALPSLWRNHWICKDIQNLNIDIYHGLSHEIPFGIEKLKAAKVVTIHDLIFEHYPKQYSKSDVAIYRKKFKYATHNSDVVIAISEATKSDLINLYHVNEQKIIVGSNVVDSIFFEPINQSQLNIVRTTYNLPERFFISVGSIIERKNLMTLCESFAQLNDSDIGLVIIGNGGNYKTKVKDFIHQHHLDHRVFFLEDNFPTHQISKDLPALYQLSLALVYPSFIEGFGLPVAEAMASGTVVITSNQSSLKEAGGEAAILINPHDKEELKAHLKQLIDSESTRQQLIEKGKIHAQLYTQEKASTFVHSIYKS